MFNFFIQFGNLGPIGIWVAQALVVALLFYLAYRIFGVIGMLVLLIILFFVYVLYSHDLFNRYEARQQSESDRIKVLEEALLG